MASGIPVIAVTTGDVAGIGPEILLKAVSGHQLGARVLAVGELSVLERAARELGVSVALRGIRAPEEAGWAAGVLDVMDLGMVGDDAFHPGCPDALTGGAMIAATRSAVRLAMEGRVEGAVGGPHSKKAAEQAGVHFEGYPLLIAEMTGARHPYLMLVAGALRVSNVTLHVSLRRALEILSTDLVYHCIRETDRATRSFGVAAPSIAVAALNPHAGEGRLFGDEDEDVIFPAIEHARTDGIDATGPHPADSLFVDCDRGRFDAYVGMYHDQAHLPVKILAFKRASAMAIGVPINWATVDHGCALDIAWRNRADENVLVETIELVAARARSAAAEHGGA